MYVDQNGHTLNSTGYKREIEEKAQLKAFLNDLIKVKSINTNKAYESTTTFLYKEPNTLFHKKLHKFMLHGEITVQQLMMQEAHDFKACILLEILKLPIQ